MARNASTFCMSTVLITLFDFLYLQLKCNIKLNFITTSFTTKKS